MDNGVFRHLFASLSICLNVINFTAMKEREIEFELPDIAEAAKEFLVYTKGYRVFAFSGELGAGKTTFISAICKELGVQDVVSSPTFAIVQQYDSDSHGNIYHMDLYRIRDEEEAINSGIEDCLQSDDICLVEWPENAPGILPDNTVRISLVISGHARRKLHLQITG